MHISKLSCFAFFAAVVYAIPTTEGNAGGLSKRAPELPPPLPGPKGYPENFWKGSRHGARPDDPTYPYRKRRGRMSPEAAAAVDDLEECIDEQWREWVIMSRRLSASTTPRDYNSLDWYSSQLAVENCYERFPDALVNTRFELFTIAAKRDFEQHTDTGHDERGGAQHHTEMRVDSNGGNLLDQVVGGFKSNVDRWQQQQQRREQSDGQPAMPIVRPPPRKGVPLQFP